MTSSARRLLMVVNNPAFLVSHRLSLALAAVKAGFEVHIAGPEGKGIDQILAAGLPYHCIHLERASINPARELRPLLGLLRLYRSLRPDLVHHVTIKPVIYGGLAARLAGIATVAAVSGRGNLFISRRRRHRAVARLVRRVYRTAVQHPRSRVILQNPDDEAFLIDQGIVHPDQVVRIRGSGVDVRLLRPTPSPAGPPMVVLAARMVVDKGVREFAEAARLLQERGVSVRMVLVGGLDPNARFALDQSELQSWIAEGVVEWWGYRSDIGEILALSSIACLPSWNEGLPKFLLEASACGRPLVATDVPGCREVVRHGENGLLVRREAPRELADALQELIEDGSLRQRMGERARSIVEEEFSLDLVIEQHLEVYEALTGSRSFGVPAVREPTR